MDNVPWHEEVLGFVQQIADRLPNYEISCEHEHSNCVLLSHVKFKSDDGGWNTWIDYPRFHQLVRQYRETGQMFTAADYMAPTPAWAVFGSKERGFDPAETRFHRKNKKKEMENGVLADDGK